MNVGGQFKEGLVSVVTPVYNGEAFVGRILSSVLNQTYTNIEMILVDDGSEDETVMAAENYRKAFEERGIPFRIISAPHMNASAAVNAGLPFVHGEYLIWPDSDDELLPDSVKIRAEYLKEHPECPAVRSLSYYVDDETGKRIPRVEKVGDLDQENLFFPILFFETFVCCGCYMLRSRLFFDIYPDRKIPEYPTGQNFQMLLPYMYHHKCHTVTDELYVVHRRQDSHSMRKLDREQEEEKCAYYEALVDDICKIVGITGWKDLRRIKDWKAWRRYKLADRFGDKRQVLFFTLKRFWHGGVRMRTAVKEIIRFFFDHGAFGRFLHWMYGAWKTRKKRKT